MLQWRINILCNEVLSIKHNPLSIYIHWPFCQSKCPYCDFNSHVFNDVPHEAFIEAYIKELEYFKDIWHGRDIQTIFFGGGTPSLAQPRFIETVINHLSNNAKMLDDVEITMEANPTTFEANKFQDFKNAGINRLSLGVQSFNSNYLEKLGRNYNGKHALECVEKVKKIFPLYSFDLIYCLPWHSFEEWQKELEFALKQCDKHISLYQLTIEKGTQFYRQYIKGQLKMLNDTLSAKFYNYTYEVLEEKGLIGYEISNHAMEGYECKHNLTYWNYGDYLGIGAGAHGRYAKDGVRYATVMEHAPFNWLKAVQEKGVGLQKTAELTNEESQTERILMGLRLKKGMPKEYFKPFAQQIEELVKLGLLATDDENVFVTKSGRLVLNSVISYILGE